MKKENITLSNCLTIVVIYVIMSIIAAKLLQYDIHFWTKYLQGKEKDMPFFYAWLVCLVPIVGQVAWIIAVITIILNFIL